MGVTRLQKPMAWLQAEDIGAVPATRTINGKPLSEDITLSAEDLDLDLSSVGGVGSSATGQMVEKEPGVTATGAVGAEVFNDYRARTYSEGGDPKEGNIAVGKYSHAEGSATTAIGDGGHAEGNRTHATGAYSHVEGYETNATSYAHAEGMSTYAKSNSAHAEGWDTKAEMTSAHAEGSKTLASAHSSHAEGYGTTANNFASHACGKFNKDMTAGADQTSKIGDAFVIGNGTMNSSYTAATKSNAFRVTYTGEVLATSAYKSSGADYAEYFEWLDGNPDQEDRVGRFVTMSGKKILPANPGDYILGVISGQPCIIGNGDEDWLGHWERDKFGRILMVDVESPAREVREVEVPILEEDGQPTGETRREFKEVETGEVVHGQDFKSNPDYDPTQPYIERKDRPEWDAVGMLGVLSVRDDGICEVDGFCQVAQGGIATAAEKYVPGTTYRVINRVSGDVVQIVFR